MNTSEKAQIKEQTYALLNKYKSARSLEEQNSIITDIINLNMHLAHDVVYKIKKRLTAVYDYDDCLQTCLLAMMAAVKNYNPNIGTEFTTYAVTTMQYNVIRCIEYFNVYADRKRVAYKQLKKQGVPTTSENILKYMETSTKTCKQAMLYPLSLDAPTFLDGKMPICERVFSKDKPIEDQANERYIVDTIKTLSPKHYSLIKKYYLEGKTLDEIAADYNLTRQGAFKALSTAIDVLSSKCCDYDEK